MKLTRRVDKKLMTKGSLVLLKSLENGTTFMQSDINGLFGESDDIKVDLKKNKMIMKKLILF